MTCLGLRIRPGAVVLAAVMACCATPLLAQSAYADPADTEAEATADRSDGAPRAAPAVDPPIVAPFAVVHPAYVPSQSAVDDAPAAETPTKPQPLRRAPVRSRPAAVTPPLPDMPEAATPSAIETPPAVETPAVTMPRPPAPAGIGQPGPAPPLAGPAVNDGGAARLLAASAGLAILLAGIGFALGRRSARRANFAGAVAKTPTWQSVMPPDLDRAADDVLPWSEPDEAVARTPGKRVKRGQSSDQAGPVAARGHGASAATPAVAHAQRVVQL